MAGSLFVPGRMAFFAMVTKDMATITDNGVIYNWGKNVKNVDSLSRKTPKIQISPIPILLVRHDTSATTTGYNRSPTLSPRLDLPGF